MTLAYIVREWAGWGRLTPGGALVGLVLLVIFLSAAISSGRARGRRDD